MKKVLWIGSMVLLGTGWGLRMAIAQPSAPTATPTPTATTVPAPTPSPETSTTKPPARPTLELLSTGAEPRQVFRLKPAPKLKQTVTMIMKMDLGLSIEGNVAPRNKVPSTVMTFETLVNRVDPNGNIQYQFRYTNVDLQGATDLPAATLKQLRSQLQSLKGINGSVMMDNRGQVKSGKLNLPPTLDPQSKQMLKSFGQSVEQMSAPLPEPAIGIGAKWRVITSPKVAGIQLSQSTTYELVGLRNNIATIKIAIDQQAPSQTINPNDDKLPKNMTMTLKSMTGNGQGQTVLRRDRIMPLSSSTSIQSNAVMEFMNSAQGNPMTMSTDTKMQLFLKSQ